MSETENSESHKNKSNFQPIRIPFVHTAGAHRGPVLNAGVTLRGEAAEIFEKMIADNNLNRSALLRQMVYHCLGLESELDAIKRQVLLYGDGHECNK